MYIKDAINLVTQNQYKTFNIIQASKFLGAHKETIRRMAANGELPGAKVGRSCTFLEQDLVMYLRNKYSTHDASQGVNRSNMTWHSTIEKESGGLISSTKEKEYARLLGLK